MDIIFVHGLKVECVIGVWEWERRIRQQLVVDLDLGADIRRAAASDQLQDTLNYKEIADRVKALAEESGCQLVETLAENIAGLLLDDLGIPWCRVRINKHGALSAAGDVGVEIERGSR